MTILNKNIFILTGAGISSESGIKTFREKDGLWDNHRIEDVCTPEAFQRNPDKVNNFYNERKVAFNGPDIKPNNGHKALVELEGICKKDFLIVTQNIDSLHEKAGSKNLLHMHGSLEKLYCMYCGHTVAYDFELDSSFICFHCKKSGKVRVDVVWFGEQPKHLQQIYKFLDKTEVFISIGTSNNVYPAAGFIDYILNRRDKPLLYEFNLEETTKSVLFTESFKGYASETLPKFIQLVSNRRY